MNNVKEDLTIYDLNELPKYKECPNVPRSCKKEKHDKYDKFCSSCGSELNSVEIGLSITLETISKKFIRDEESIKFSMSLEEFIKLLKSKW